MLTLYIPRDTTVFCSQDWGYNKPGVLLWWFDVGDGHWHIGREFKFQQMNADSQYGAPGVAETWHTMNKEMGISRVQYVAADPSMWAKTGHGKGEAIAETLARRPWPMPMLRADNDRPNGWRRCHALLRLAPDGRPWVTVDVTCVYGLRSLPAQQSDKHDADDINTAGDDHWADAFRYGAMSRFVARDRTGGRRPPKVGTLGHWKQLTAEPASGVLARRGA